MSENATSASLLLTVVRSLYFGEDRSELLRGLSADQWEKLLVLTDNTHITLALASRCRGVIAGTVLEQIEARLTQNYARHARVVEEHVRIVEAMRSRGVEFVVLKGLTHSGLWNSDHRHRPQYDVDLYCPAESIHAAVEAAASLGYEPVASMSNASDHLPVMIRRTGWRWRGDYYDPDQPLALELHHRFWNPTLGFSVNGADRFWSRRRPGMFAGIVLPSLHPADGLTYAAWHAVRHMLQGGLHIGHAYELAHFLHYSAEDHEFWREWREYGAPADRLAESVAFRLAMEWFGCRMNPVAEDYSRTLPANVERWFRLFSFSSITKVGRPNKDELFLSFCLARNKRELFRIAVRRLFPVAVPATVPDAHVCSGDLRYRTRLWIYRAGFIARRGFFHLRTLVPVVRSGVRWLTAR